MCGGAREATAPELGGVEGVDDDVAHFVAEQIEVDGRRSFGGGLLRDALEARDVRDVDVLDLLVEDIHTNALCIVETRLCQLNCDSRAGNEVFFRLPLTVPIIPPTHLVARA